MSLLDDLADWKHRGVISSAQHDAIAANQKRWVQAHASIEKATQNLEKVYERYVRRDALGYAA